MLAATELHRALRYDADDRQRLAAVLLQRKVQVYARTLVDLANQAGFDVDEPGLGRSVLAALRREARAHAKLIVDGYNDALKDFLDQLPEDTDTIDALNAVDRWATQRASERGTLVAVTEVYSAHADATVAFFLDNGLEPLFDFGGHGDDAPACAICVQLVATSPHPLARVLSIGVPHIQCRQEWHPRFDPGDLPNELVLGRSPAGIVGGETLQARHGGTEQAAAYVRDAA